MRRAGGAGHRLARFALEHVLQKGFGLVIRELGRVAGGLGVPFDVVLGEFRRPGQLVRLEDRADGLGGVAAGGEQGGAVTVQAAEHELNRALLQGIFRPVVQLLQPFPRVLFGPEIGAADAGVLLDAAEQVGGRGSGGLVVAERAVEQPLGLAALRVDRLAEDAEPAELARQRGRRQRRSSAGPRRGGGGGRASGGRVVTGPFLGARAGSGGEFRRRRGRLVRRGTDQRLGQPVQLVDVLLHPLPALLGPLEAGVERFDGAGKLLLLVLRELEVLPQRQELGVDAVDLHAQVGGLLPRVNRAVVQLDRLLPLRVFRFALQAPGLDKQAAALGGEVLGLLLELADVALERGHALLDGLQRRQRAGLVLLPDRVLLALHLAAVLLKRGPLLRRLQLLEPGHDVRVGLEPRPEAVDLGDELTGGDLLPGGPVEQGGRALQLRLREPGVRLGPRRGRRLGVGGRAVQHRGDGRQLAPGLRLCLTLVELFLHLAVGAVGRVIAPELRANQPRTADALNQA